MEFWASTECFEPAAQAVTHCRRLLEDYLNKALAGTNLAAVKGEFRYVPIVMPPEMAANYPPRSELRKDDGNGVYCCAPQLDYETFIKGSFEQQMAEHTRGILMEAAQITGLGASLDQVNEFEDLVITARFDITGQPGAAASGPLSTSPQTSLMEEFMACSRRVFQDGAEALSPQEVRSELLKMRALIVAGRDSGEAKAPREFIERYLATLDEAAQVLDEGGDVEAALEIMSSVEIPGLRGV